MNESDYAPAPKPDDEDKKKQRSFLAELPLLIGIALIIAIVLRTFLMQAFYIPSRSMVPTLLINDRVMVNKLVPQFGDFERGDVVVFSSPFVADEGTEPFPARALRTVKESIGITTAAVPDDLIKRIVGLPGETVEIRDNALLIDGLAIDEPYLNDGTFMADMPPRTLRDDELWVMGDNRNESSDSRRFGPIKVDNVVGRAFVRFWPSDRWGGL